ncbi:unnamed protein product [Adineta ricciae]|uniref:Uncharacterized protein n=1 Tax=Adineta ricciae TaxID=249248 RepID=A0A815M7F9_ADIRI|nr:unnamed protein product [Adineta ricciae]CAF1415520.1 unnamed protein product [Adineta ricciae]
MHEPEWIYQLPSAILERRNLLISFLRQNQFPPMTPEKYTLFNLQYNIQKRPYPPIESDKSELEPNSSDSISHPSSNDPPYFPITSNQTHALLYTNLISISFPVLIIAVGVTIFHILFVYCMSYDQSTKYRFCQILWHYWS